jgi:hypothetical protein
LRFSFSRSRCYSRRASDVEERLVETGLELATKPRLGFGLPLAVGVALAAGARDELNALVRELDTLVGLPCADGLPIGNASISLPKPKPREVPKWLPWNDTDAAWHELVLATRKALVLADRASLPYFDTLAARCSGAGFDLLSLVGFSPDNASAGPLRTGGSWFSSSPSSPSSKSGGRSGDWRRTSGICLAFYTLAFMNTPECLSDAVISYTTSEVETEFPGVRNMSSNALLSDFNVSLLVVAQRT